MTTIDQSIEVDVHVRTAYNQWTQFEEFPEFMQDVEEVKQLDPTHLHWVVSISGTRHEWDAVITEQIPDQRIAWRATSGKQHEGQVTFDKLGENRTAVHVQLVFEPEGLKERMADALGLASAHVQRDLQRFKSFVESRQSETGAWRGEVHETEVTRGPADAPRSQRLREQTESSGES